MSDCRKCAKCEECAADEDCGLFVAKPMTNADRIRTMNDEELAQWICCHITECARCEGRHYDGQECEFRDGRSTGLLRWLKATVEVDNG